MTDTSIMPFGKYKGKQLGRISDGYLQTLYDRGAVKGSLAEYIRNRIPMLRMEAKKTASVETVEK